MSTAASAGGGAAGGTKKKGGRAKWIALLIVVLAVFIGIQTGLAGYGWAHLKSAVYPSDTGLLDYIPADEAAVVIIDPHQIDEASLGEEQGTARVALKRVRDDINKAAGIDVAFDIDKLVLTPTVAVARGRFNRAKLEERLIESRYVAAEHKGARVLVRQGEDAIAVVGSVLLYGNEAGVRAAIDAEADDKSLGEDEPTNRRLKQMGWDRAALATIRVSEDRPSLRAVLTGSTGPRAVTVGVATKPGKLVIDVLIEAASASAADELAKLIEEKRAQPAATQGFLGEEASQVIAEVAKSATVQAEPATSSVRIHIELDPATQEKIAGVAGKALPAQGADLYKALRLYQLLTPGL
jgi:hypothetical protein